MRERWLGTVLLGLLCAGCADVAQSGAADAAVAFVGSSPEAACHLLAPNTAETLASKAGTDCAQAMAELQLPVGNRVEGVEVAGESAQVVLEDQVVFLAHFPEGWRVTAAGCTRQDPDPAVPYQCQVEP